MRGEVHGLAELRGAEDVLTLLALALLEVLEAFVLAGVLVL